MSVAAMNGRARPAADSDSDGSSRGSDGSGSEAGGASAVTAAFQADVGYFEAMIDLIPAKYYIRDEEAEAQHWMNSRFYRVRHACWYRWRYCAVGGRVLVVACTSILSARASVHVTHVAACLSHSTRLVWCALAEQEGRGTQASVEGEHEEGQEGQV